MATTAGLGVCSSRNGHGQDGRGCRADSQCPNHHNPSGRDQRGLASLEVYGTRARPPFLRTSTAGSFPQRGLEHSEAALPSAEMAARTTAVGTAVHPTDDYMNFPIAGFPGPR
jgi:hypothetical protein